MIFRGKWKGFKMLNTCILHYLGLYVGKNNYTKIVLAFPDFGSRSKFERLCISGVRNLRLTEYRFISYFLLLL